MRIATKYGGKVPVELIMVNWNETINIAGLYRLFSNGDISLQDLSRAVVRKLKNTEAFAISEPELIDIMCAFEAVDDLAQYKDYTTALDMLYEFGNKECRLWIEAEGVSPQEYDEVTKTKNPLDKTDGEWVKVPASSNISTTESTILVAAPWSKDKMYEVDDVVSRNNSRFKCVISCCNIDPGPNSYKVGDCWKWLGSQPRTPFDPALALKDRISCIIPSGARIYPATRKYHYMSEDDFDKKLSSSGIEPASLQKDFYSYMKDCEEPYQQWLIDRWHKQNLTLRDCSLIV